MVSSETRWDGIVHYLDDFVHWPIGFDFIRQKKVLLGEMQSLLGLLAYACKVMPVGHIFSRRLYLSTAGYKSPFSHLCLTADLKEDLL